VNHTSFPTEDHLPECASWGNQAKKGDHVERSHSYTPPSVRFLWTSDQPDAETSTDKTQHSQETDVHAPGRIQTHNHSKQAATDLP
jgi:hypothetical protein